MTLPQLKRFHSLTFYSLTQIGLTFTAIFISLLSYVGDSYLLFAASALASNTMFRSGELPSLRASLCLVLTLTSHLTALGAAFPLFTPLMWDPKGSLGPLHSCLILGSVALLLSPSPFLFYRFG